MERSMQVLAMLSVLLVVSHLAKASLEVRYDPHQPLSKVALHRSLKRLDSSVSITATPDLLGQKGETAEYVTVMFKKSIGAAVTDWIGVFSPAIFDGSQCLNDLNATYEKNQSPYLCSSPIKFQYANFSIKDYLKKGEGSLKFRLINLRSDYTFGFFSGDLDNPVLEAKSNTVTFKNPKAPVYPRLAIGESWNEMTVTWTSGYSIKEARPLVQWRWEEERDYRTSLAVTLTFTRNDVCGPPASTVGWRDPGFIHTAFLKELWASSKYYYKVGHKLKDGQYVWGEEKYFTSAPFPGQDSLQRVIIFGDMGKAERDGSNEYTNNQLSALNTTDQLVKDLDNYDLAFHIGDITYANGYLSEWDQFTEQVEGITSRVPYMLASGNHERDWPGTGSFYENTDSGGECGVVAETLYNVPTKNKDKYWYATDWGMFHFCVADSETDWREGTEQHKFLEECLASVDRQRQPWLIFIAHRVLGYSSGQDYASEGTFAEPMARESLQKLWQKYKVDIAFYGHVHNYERSCPVYENNCVSDEKDHYSGIFNATIHMVVGAAGKSVDPFSTLNTAWSLVKGSDHGFAKLTAYDHSNLLYEYKRSDDGSVFDKFWITRKHTDVLGCDASFARNCPEVTLADHV